MRTEILAASELASLIVPVLILALTCGIKKEWKSRLLVSSQLVVFMLSLGGVATALVDPAAEPVNIGWGAMALRFDLTGTLLISSIYLIAAVVITFSERYLSGESYRLQFLWFVSLLSSCAACLTATDSIMTAMVLWNLLSFGLWGTVRLDQPGRKTAGTVLGHHLLSDSSMILAAVLLMASTGVTRFSQLTESVGLLDSNLALVGNVLPVSVGSVFSALLVLAFSIKSALFPFHRWLIATLNAPTPLSGLLHAGVVNVSALMAWRLMPVLQENTGVLACWAGLAALSGVVGTLSMSAQPDVKRKLVYSTIGQMGFMSLQCASGFVGAALFHMVAHGLFKCHMFLQSGSAVAEGVSKKKFGSGASLPPRYAHLVQSNLAMLVLAFGTCAILYQLNQEHSLTWMSTVIAAFAVLSALPSTQRAPALSLGAWSVLLGLVIAAAATSTSFEKLVHMPLNESSWLLFGFFAASFVLTALINLAGHSGWARALYVHSLNGFYGDEMATRLTAINYKGRTI